MIIYHYCEQIHIPRNEIMKEIHLHMGLCGVVWCGVWYIMLFKQFTIFTRLNTHSEIQKIMVSCVAPHFLAPTFLIQVTTIPPFSPKSTVFYLF